MTQCFEIKLFAAAKQSVGQDAVQIELEGDIDVRALRSELERQFPELSKLLPHSRFAVNAAYASDSTRVVSSDEIACIPPVSGG